MERTFSWFGWFRRLTLDYAEVMVYNHRVNCCLRWWSCDICPPPMTLAIVLISDFSIDSGVLGER